jgi:carbon monoxide dehydrogenase subunit G
MKRLFVFALFSVILFSSCHHFFGRHIKGNGNVITQPRNISGFNRVEVSSAIHLYVKQDPAFSVKVEIDEDLQRYIIVTNEDGTLHIQQENNTNLDATGQIKVYVSAPLIKYMGASGACKIITENMITDADGITVHVSGASNAEVELNAPKISTEMSGASDITIKGETKDLIVNGSGASHARLFDLKTENADVDVSGASSTEVFASVKLKADASGASHVKYKGNPALDRSESGAGKVDKVD